jgi:hypothetical protein
MQISRREAIEELLDFMGEKGDSDARASAERMLIRVLQTIWLKHTWGDHVSPDPWQITTIANQRSYALPDHFGRPVASGVMRNLTTGDTVQLITKNDLEDQHPEAGTTFETADEPSSFFIGGTQPVGTQPASTGDALLVVSDSAADTTIKVTVIGEDATGIERRTVVTLTGLAQVAVGNFRKITTFGKAYPAAQEPTTAETSSEGTVTLFKAVRGDVLESLLPDESSRERLVLTLFPKPDGVYSLALPFIRAPRRPIYDSDTLPRFWHPAVFEEARLEWALNMGEINLASFTTAPRPRLKELIEFDNALTYGAMRTEPFQG